MKSCQICKKDTESKNGICDICREDGWINGKEMVDEIRKDPELSKAVGIVYPIKDLE